MTTFSIFAILIILVLLFLVLVLQIKLQKTKKENEGKSYEVQKKAEGANEYNLAKSKEREERKERVLEFLKEKGKITNNDIESLLSVSDSTATTYLDELEKEGKIKQIGDEGRGVFYELNPPTGS